MADSPITVRSPTTSRFQAVRPSGNSRPIVIMVPVMWPKGGNEYEIG